MGDAKPCERCAPQPGSPGKLDEMRFDYAWKWFEFHAEQRTKMFNFMLIGMGIFATAFVTAVEKKLELEAAVLSSAAVVIALVFCLIDHRNRQLYIVAMDVLIDMEKGVVFSGRENNMFLDHRNREKRWGVSSRMAWEDKSASEQERLRTDPGAQPLALSYSASLWRQIEGMLRGQHRYWMPFVAFSFATLFLVAATRAWLVYSKAVPSGWVSLEGAALIVLGAVCAIRRWKKLKESNVWPLACLLVGIGFVSAAACSPSLGRPLASDGEIEVSVGADLNNVLDLRLRQPLSNAQNAPLGTLLTAQFGPFASGSDALDCNSATRSQAVSDVRAALEDAGRRNQRAAVLLVGSTDRTALTPALRRKYGSDAGLARARIAAVERCLWPPGVTTVPSDVLRVISGPAYAPVEPEAASAALRGMEGDRVVRLVLVGLQSR